VPVDRLPLRIAPVTLTGRFVRLEPLGEQHLEALERYAYAPGLFRWFPLIVRDRESLLAYIRSALAAQAAGSALPFATVRLGQGDGEVVGSTRYMNISAVDGRMEIGSTWIGEPHQRSVVNSEAKYLMLAHAFETLGACRVELKTHVRNDKSRNAIARIGGVFEGIHRKHTLMPDGTMRDTAWYSIVDDEWPAVKTRLEAKIR
jgi:RimJ/RimL family protein N-acetyltransferase